MKRRKMWAVQVPGNECLSWRYDEQHGGRKAAELALRNLEKGKGKVVRVIEYR